MSLANKWFLIAATLMVAAGAASMRLLARAPEAAVSSPSPGVPDVEIRAFWNWLPNRASELGNGVFLYGMRVLGDGSETVVWSKKVCEPAGLIWDLGTYEVAAPSPERAYVYFSDGIGGPLSMPRPSPAVLWELDRRSGQILRTFEATTPEFESLRSSLTWWPLRVDLRPRPARVEPQR